MAEPPDYPAAHSMDTYWFALDRDGHVGYFISGEGGAIPAGANPGESGPAWPNALAPLQGSNSQYDLNGFLGSAGQRGAGRHACLGRQASADVLMFLSSPDAVRQQVAAGQATPVAATTEAAVIFRTLDEQTARQLHEGGGCLSCFLLREYEVDLTRDCSSGMYVYGHPTDYYGGRSRDAVSGLYGRLLVPAQPAHIDQLAPAVRRVVTAVRLRDLCFAETAHLQPCEWGDVESMNAAYLASDGCTIRRIPNNVWDYAEPAHYRAFYDWLRAEDHPWLEGLVVTPPEDEERNTEAEG